MRIIIIGAGPGGYETALLAAKRGVEVVLIESGHVGGTCLNEGCIPTKSFCRNAEVLDTLKEASVFGVSDLSYTFDFPAVRDRKNAVVEQLRGGVESLLTNTLRLSVARLPSRMSIQLQLLRMFQVFRVLALLRFLMTPSVHLLTFRRPM